MKQFKHLYWFENLLSQALITMGNIDLHSFIILGNLKVSILPIFLSSHCIQPCQFQTLITITLWSTTPAFSTHKVLRKRGHSIWIAGVAFKTLPYPLSHLNFCLNYIYWNKYQETVMSVRKILTFLSFTKL